MIRASPGRVLVAGSINMDIVATVDRHPTPGETVVGAALAYVPGGKGANQAVAAARAGAAVVMLGAVGSDTNAAELLKFLESNAIDVDSVARRAGEPSGVALVIVDASGENEIVVIAGANGSVDEEIVAEIDVTNTDVLLAQYETPIATTQAFFEAGSFADATCVLNPAPAAEVPDQLLGLVDVLIVNETELGIVSRTELPEQLTVSDVRGADHALRVRGYDATLVVTLGARGSIALTGDQVIEVPARTVDVVDTTGAGDCFVGYLAGALVEGRTIDRVLRTATVAASLCVELSGAGPSMPTRARVLQVMESEDGSGPGAAG